MADILLTGATGFIGRRLLPRLSARHRVWAITRRRRVNHPDDPIRWLHHDLADPLPPVGLPRRIDAVIHLAQSPHYRDFPSRAREIHAVATGACMMLLEWARQAGATRFVLASTGGLYPPTGDLIRESDPVTITPGPLGFYFASKRAAEQLASQYAGLFSTVILRFFFIYGSGQNPVMLMPRLIRSVRAGDPVTLQGRDGVVLNPVFVDDAADAIVRCLMLDHPTTINIAGPEALPLRHIVETIAELVGRPPMFVPAPGAEPNTAPFLVSDTGRMAALLGAPRIGIREGLLSLVADDGDSA